MARAMVNEVGINYADSQSTPPRSLRRSYIFCIATFICSESVNMILGDLANMIFKSPQCERYTVKLNRRVDFSPTSKYEIYTIFDYTALSEHTMKTIRVAAAIIVKNNRILAAQRGYGEFKGGWEFPGGKLEEGETGEQACVREIQEELSVTIEDLKHLYTVEHDYESFHLSMECFTCTIASGEIQDTEHENLRWLDRNTLWSVDWLPADIKVVEALEAALA